ncbi:hypothetical protein G5714_022872 [Onychostoma macrolepis]|uniref:Uncharacterized protein n=1 Tax=Onychostoma macrolepis TaxID=369639 RepID=A0A7J6BR13_9TELE|nr:hypothetical protein G5714_022872 [Onychostoma macrolepis]
MMKSVRVQLSAALSAVRKEFGVFQRAYAPYAPLLSSSSSSSPLLSSLLLSSIHPRELLSPLRSFILSDSLHPLTEDRSSRAVAIVSPQCSAFGRKSARQTWSDRTASDCYVREKFSRKEYSRRRLHGSRIKDVG